jgi:hypothetical protein
MNKLYRLSSASLSSLVYYVLISWHEPQILNLAGNARLEKTICLDLMSSASLWVSVISLSSKLN